MRKKKCLEWIGFIHTNVQDSVTSLLVNFRYFEKARKNLKKSLKLNGNLKKPVIDFLKFCYLFTISEFLELTVAQPNKIQFFPSKFDVVKQFLDWT